MRCRDAHAAPGKLLVLENHRLCRAWRVPGPLDRAVALFRKAQGIEGAADLLVAFALWGLPRNQLFPSPAGFGWHHGILHLIRALHAKSDADLSQESAGCARASAGF